MSRSLSTTHFLFFHKFYKMQKVPQLVLDAVRRSQGKVLVVGSASSAARPRSAFHAVMQASQSTGIPCVPFTPPVADVGAAPASLMDVALDGLGMARRTGCGSVVVVGGGCTVEIAKRLPRSFKHGIIRCAFDGERPRQSTD